MGEDAPPEEEDAVLDDEENESDAGEWPEPGWDAQLTGMCFCRPLRCWSRQLEWVWLASYLLQISDRSDELSSCRGIHARNICILR